jgi:hypothetical protein
LFSFASCVAVCVDDGCPSTPMPVETLIVPSRSPWGKRERPRAGHKQRFEDVSVLKLHVPDPDLVPGLVRRDPDLLHDRRDLLLTVRRGLP